MSENYPHGPLAWLRKGFPASTDSVDVPLVLLSLTFLALLTLADAVTTSTVPAVLKDKTPLEPGYWNLGAASVIASTFTDLISQLILGNLADRKGRSYAIFLNATSILFTSIFTLFALVFGSDAPVLATAIAPLLKFVGGGSHASAFLTLVLLHDQTSKSPRVAFFYSTGAIVTLCQAAATALVGPLLKYSIALPGVFSVICCVLAYVVSFAYLRVMDSPFCEAHSPSSQPLLPDLRLSPAEPTPDQESSWLIPFGLSAAATSESLGIRAVTENKTLFLASSIFSIAAISKATRPLFTTYIQRRYDVSPSKAQQLWLTRTAMSATIFAIILPLVVLYYPKATSPTPIKTAYSTARISICLMGTGALMIGLALTQPVLISALVVNTLGVATDLSILGSIVSLLPHDSVGRAFMLIASLESLGTLVGIGILYPIYQWSLKKAFSYAGGTAYYICAALYAIVAVLVWRMRPAPSSSSN